MKTLVFSIIWNVNDGVLIYFVTICNFDLEKNKIALKSIAIACFSIKVDSNGHPNGNTKKLN